ncbi:hypothetical protein [Longimicrobium sp.]|uniref:hypothetical protein n=1 Tax=Longimicrobium sp. TaxID=2029185 RepID=UPI003B3B1445
MYSERPTFPFPHTRAASAWTLCLLAASLAIVAGARPLATQATSAYAESAASPPRALPPVEYDALLREAARLREERDFAGAAAAYTRLAAAHPVDGDLWAALGDTRRLSGDCVGALPAYRRALRLGSWRAADHVLSGARCFAALGQADSAPAWIRHGLFQQRSLWRRGLLRDTTLASLWQNPEFRTLAGAAPGDSLTRDEGWRHDLDYLMAEIRRVDAVHSLAPLPDSVAAAAERLRRRIPELTDAGVLVQMQRIVAMIGRSHGEVFTHRQPTRVRFPEPLPITLRDFPEGLYVVEADSGLAHLVGQRLVSVDGTPVDRVAAAIRPLMMREGNPEQDLLIERYVIQPHVLHALGVSRAPDRATFGFVDAAGRRRAENLVSTPGHRYGDLPPSRLPGAGPVPLYMSRPAEPLWLQALPDDSALYVRIREIRDQPGLSMAQLGRQLARAADSTAATRLIVDIRGNEGGRTQSYAELAGNIIGFRARPGRQVYLLIDRHVFSAALNLTLDLERFADPLIVGERTLGQPKLHGDAVLFQLPWSGAWAMLADRYWQLTTPEDDRSWVAPEVPVRLTAADYFANRDPVMDAVRALMRSRPPAP